MNRIELLEIAKPIIFNTEMVRAILDGRKTQTRRTVKVKLPYSQKQLNERMNYRSKEECDRLLLGGKHATVGFWTPVDGYVTHKDSQYQIGDILYVRETWNCIRFGNGKSAPFETEYWYKADEKFNNPDNKWRPSIHMPEEAARIFLRVTNVRVERLQDILCGDMKKEGCIPNTVTGGQYQQWQCDYFIPLWDSTIKKSDFPHCGWNANPWVWVYEFERVVEE